MQRVSRGRAATRLPRTVRKEGKLFYYRNYSFGIINAKEDITLANLSLSLSLPYS